MIETRLKQIFDYLTADYAYHTAAEISQVMKLSAKTVRSEIAHLNAKIEGHGIHIDAKAGKGYRFVIDNNDQFKAFLKNDWYKIAYFQQASGEKNVRYENIMRIFLFSNSYIKQRELAEMFHVSTSQINKDLPVIKENLKRYHLELVSKPYYGMKVMGKEKDIRMAIKQEIGEDPALFDEDKDKGLFNAIQDVIDTIDFGDFYMPYINFKNLVIHIYIAILRIEQKQYIQLSKKVANKVVSYDEFKVANKIVVNLQEKLAITIPHEELLYITMHLIAKNTVIDQEKISTDILNLSQAMIEEIYRVSKYDFRDNINLYFSLALHLGPLIHRIKYGFTMKNPILDDIKENKIAFLLATIGSNVINEKYKTTLSEDEIAYLSLHIMAAIESSSYRQFKILLVCGSGNASAQIMKAQLERQFKRNIKTITTTDIGSIEQEDLDSYDFIVSSVDLNVQTETPIVYVDVLFKQSDLDNIQTALDKENLDEIYHLFYHSLFIKQATIKNKQEALQLLAEKIALKTTMTKDEILSQLNQREQMGLTAYENIAIPHILDSTQGDSFTVIITLKTPIQWDDQQVKIIYSLVTGKKVDRMDLYYEKLGDFLSNPPLIEEAVHANSPSAFMKLFLKGADDGHE
ncbi:MAG: BglG family transcription antiterminator [Aerococcus sp.]|nr:BglG family transcription antiterminator [Aerococcus sp.]